MDEYDIVIIGSGVGGGCTALTLADTGARILVLERGERLPREPQNWDPEAVFVDLRYRSRETWYDGSGNPFRPGQYYYVGGHTKVYGLEVFRDQANGNRTTPKPSGCSWCTARRAKTRPSRHGRALTRFRRCLTSRSWTGSSTN